MGGKKRPDTIPGSRFRALPLQQGIGANLAQGRRLDLGEEWQKNTGSAEKKCLALPEHWRNFCRHFLAVNFLRHNC